MERESRDGIPVVAEGEQPIREQPLAAVGVREVVAQVHWRDDAVLKFGSRDAQLVAGFDWNLVAVADHHVHDLRSEAAEQGAPNRKLCCSESQLAARKLYDRDRDAKLPLERGFELTEGDCVVR